MLKKCLFCDLEYKAKTSRSNYCSKPCKNGHWFVLNKDHKRQYYIDNLEQIQAREKEYTLNGIRKQKNKKYYDANSEKIKAKKRLRNKNNRESINAYHREYYKNINNRLRKNLRGRLSCAIQRGFDGSRGGSFVRDLGCSIQEFKIFMEQKFQPGMTWENYGWGENKWHLDHIVPLVSFNLTDPEQFKKAAHHTNYQPLWQPDNFKKGAR